MVFGIDDFDDAFPGPWEWDLKLLAEVVAEFSEAYADRVEKDYQALVEAGRRGRVEARKGL